MYVCGDIPCLNEKNSYSGDVRHDRFLTGWLYPKKHKMSEVFITFFHIGNCFVRKTC